MGDAGLINLGMKVIECRTPWLIRNIGVGDMSVYDTLDRLIPEEPGNALNIV